MKEVFFCPGRGEFTLHYKKALIISVLSLAAFFLISWQAGFYTNPNESQNAGDSGKNNKFRLYSLQLERPLEISEKNKLAEQVDWMGQPAGNSIMVRTSEETANKLKKLPYVKGISAYEPAEKLAGELKNNTRSNVSPKEEKIELMLTLVKPEDKEDAVKLVKELGGSIIDGANTHDSYLRVMLPTAGLEKITVSPQVLYVEEYHQPGFLNDRARDITGAAPLAIPDFFTPGGLTGKNLIVGLADSGLDTGELGSLHPDLSNDTGKRPRVLMISSLAGLEKPADYIGHGTHMAGTIVGNGAASGGKFAGIAPDASLYFQGIVDKSNNIMHPHDLKLLFKPAYEAGVRIHVNGWGRKTNQYSSSSRQVDEFVRQNPDFLAIFGSGNFGPDTGTLTAEANSKNALVVGASRSPRPVFDNDAGDTLQVADFTSAGPTADGRIKPELLAPGTSIISTCSSLVESNLAGYEFYTRMQGTSMAAAVTGGSAALLAECLHSYKGHEKPSAALFKALLINGARPVEGDLQKVGFGLLDIAGTVLALEKGLFIFEDEKKGIAQGEVFTREFEVNSPAAPFKVTLAWTDPPASPGATTALVNNLDLVVTGPNGKKYFGNDSGGRGLPDNKNNVEQVVVENPAPGKYKIEVHGTSVNTSASPVLNMVKQDFALVYGQPPVESVLAGVEDNKLKLASGAVVDKPDNLRTSIDGRITSLDPLPGADIYMTAGTSGNPGVVMAVNRSWRVSGIKALSSDYGVLMVRINQNYREGGYYIAEHPENTVELNGIKLSSGVSVPPGASIEASINPTTQRLWRVRASSKEEEGIIKELDWENKELELLNSNNRYKVAPDLYVILNDATVEGDPESIPFGAPVPGNIDSVVPGLPVRLIMDRDGTVYNIAVERHIVVGTVGAVDVTGRKFTLVSGGEYSLLPGVELLKNEKNALFSSLQKGDLVMGVLNPGSKNLLALSAYSNYTYGRVYFVGRDTLYVTDSNLVSRQYKYDGDTRVYRWGLASDSSLLAPGQWVRLIVDEKTGTLLRVDIAENAFQGREVVQYYNPENNLLSTFTGNNYIITSKTSITKNGYPVQAEDLRPGEVVDLVSVRGPIQTLVSVSAYTSVSGDLRLVVESTIPFEDFCIVKGNTSASKLVAWHADGKADEVELTQGGEFYYPVYYPHGDGIQLVAVDSESGAVTGVSVKLPGYRGRVFSDIAGHWAEADISSLVSRGMIAGYGNGYFQPERAISRAEFTVMLTRLLGGQNGLMPQLEYKDTGDIPGWAISSVRLAQGRGLITGYEDNTFRPMALITRAEAAVMFVRLADALNIGLGNENPAPRYIDAASIPGWALASVNTAGRAGLLNGREGGRFMPQAYITRAETAVVLNRLLNMAGNWNHDVNPPGIEN